MHTRPESMTGRESHTLSTVDVLTVVVVLVTLLALGVLCRSAQAYGTEMPNPAIHVMR